MKRQLLQHILELTKQQTIALEKEDIEQFEGLMAKKQEEIDKIEALHRAEPTYRAQKEEDLLIEIVNVDKANSIEFTRQFEEVQKKLRQIRSQKKVGNVYSNPYDISREEGVFFDKK